MKSNEWYMNKPLSKNLQNIDMSETVKFGIYKCYWSGEKTHFEKTTFKDMYCNWIYRHKNINCNNKISWRHVNKPLSTILQNIERNKIEHFGVCKCCWIWEIIKKKNLEKTSIKDMYCNWIYRRNEIKCNKINTLKSETTCYEMPNIPKSQNWKQYLALP